MHENKQLLELYSFAFRVNIFAEESSQQYLCSQGFGATIDTWALGMFQTTKEDNMGFVVFIVSVQLHYQFVCSHFLNYQQKEFQCMFNYPFFFIYMPYTTVVNHQHKNY